MSWRTTFLYLPFVFLAIAFATFVLPLRIRRRWKAVWGGFLLLCLLKFIGFAVLGGDAFTPVLPEKVLWAWDWLYSGAVILCALGVLTFFFRFRLKAWILPLIAWGLSARGLYNGMSVPEVHEVEVAFRNLPPNLDGYRLVQLADLHCSCAARRWRTQAVVDRVNALKPDLVCLTGDLADGSFDEIAGELEPLRQLCARDGVYACTGNHEYYRDHASWKSRFYASADNIRFLCNECVSPRAGLSLGGVPDKVGHRRGLDVVPDVRGCFFRAAQGDFRLLLQHRPKGAEISAREVGVDLQLSGHTHGGIAPILRGMVARHNGGYSRGLYRLGESALYVSPGCGQWAGFPMRFFNDSEITVLKLRRVP